MQTYEVQSLVFTSQQDSIVDLNDLSFPLCLIMSGQQFHVKKKTKKKNKKKNYVILITSERMIVGCFYMLVINHNGRVPILTQNQKGM